MSIWIGDVAGTQPPTCPNDVGDDRHIRAGDLYVTDSEMRLCFGCAIERALNFPDQSEHLHRALSLIHI